MIVAVHHGWTAFAHQQDLAGIFRARSQQQDTLPPLRNAEAPRVNGSIGPGEPQLLQLRGEESHRLPPVQLQHEGDVFEEEPSNIRILDQPKDLADETRLGSGDSGRLAGLAEILAREPGRNEIDGWQQVQVANVRSDGDIRKVVGQNRSRGFVDLAEEFRLVPGEMESLFDPSDSREQARDVQQSLFAFRLR